jgi:hypothetical protein
MKFHAKARIGIITAVTFGAISGVALAPTAASATPLRASAIAAAAARPDILSYYCEDNICMGNANEGTSDKPDIAVYADEYTFYGHFELQTPDHKTYNSPEDTTHRTGTNNLFYFGVKAGTGQYCATAWEGSNGDYEKIGYVCETFPMLWKAKLKGDLFTRGGECQRENACLRIKRGAERQDDFLMVAVTVAAAELAQVPAAEVVLGVDGHHGPFALSVGVKDPPARLRVKEQVPGSGFRDETVDPHRHASD